MSENEFKEIRKILHDGIDRAIITGYIMGFFTIIVAYGAFKFVYWLSGS